MPLITRLGLVFALGAATIVGAQAASLRTLHVFTGCITSSCDGANPSGALIFDKTGEIYGTTSNGGDASFDGTAFRLNPVTGAETLLHAFSGGDDGGNPLAGFVLGPSDGLLHGTARPAAPTARARSSASTRRRRP